MLLKLKKYLQSGESLDSSDIEELNNIFNEILWYKENGFEKPISLIEDVYNLFRDIFPYTGLVYRGVCVKEHDEFQYRNEISSFTSNKNVAENFARSCDTSANYLISQNISEALDFAGLLTELAENEILLYEDINNFLGEDEIICFIKENCKVTTL